MDPPRARQDPVSDDRPGPLAALTGAVPPPLTAQPAVRLAIAVGVQFVLAAVVAALLSGAAGVLLYLLVSSLLARTLRRGRALVIGVTGWAFATGFAVHRFGLLTFTEPDLMRLVVFLLTVAILARHGHPR